MMGSGKTFALLAGFFLGVVAPSEALADSQTAVISQLGQQWMMNTAACCAGLAGVAPNQPGACASGAPIPGAVVLRSLTLVLPSQLPAADKVLLATLTPPASAIL